eukprot:29404-Pelagococcus_subviridis.AAC.5
MTIIYHRERRSSRRRSPVVALREGARERRRSVFFQTSCRAKIGGGRAFSVARVWNFVTFRDAHAIHAPRTRTTPSAPRARSTTLNAIALESSTAAHL